ncbi:hypothetical protein B296_00032832 [Ensete ventricosum]|uniref:Uncharacterized protein n=1 Tax=Ensete ventricosum TaxID=4639 RepID=A0A426Z878_ENSVE|nr:hypothetical protein B296_00032832 [Ensete ventricosum]
MRRCWAPAPTAGVVPAGGTSTGIAPCWRSLLRVAALAGDASARRRSSCRRRARSRLLACGMLPLRATARTYCNLAVAYHPLSLLPSL